MQIFSFYKKPRTDNCLVLDAYWKVNSALEVATPLNTDRMKNVTCNLKTHLDGDITAGLSLIEKCNSIKYLYLNNQTNRSRFVSAFKLEVCFRFNIRNFCSFEF